MVTDEILSCIRGPRRIELSGGGCCSGANTGMWTGAAVATATGGGCEVEESSAISKGGATETGTSIWPQLREQEWWYACRMERAEYSNSNIVI
jgi:hypothetical protein